MASLAAENIHNFTMTSIDGKPVPLANYKGKVLLIVNTASECGYTYQYQGLQNLYTKYAERGLVILGFPANNFGGQEPGSNAEIKSFCARRFKISFPMFSKISVKGSDQAPLYKHLIAAKGEVRWNFTKFLVDRDGRVLAKFESSTDPESPELVAAIEKALR